MKSFQEIKDWLGREYVKAQLRVKRISFSRSREWRWDEDGAFSHITGRFFRVVGLEAVFTPGDFFVRQPILDQSEIGLLCFLVARDQEDWWVLAHAKVEPGNVNGVQLAPTVQATKSNYEAVHGGGRTLYLDIAQGRRGVLYRRLQSEQNSRFLAKRNLNKVVLLPEKTSELDFRFKWIRMSELLPLLGRSHLVNTDARSVIAGWLFGDLDELRRSLPARGAFAEALARSSRAADSLNGDRALEEWLVKLNAEWTLARKIVPLSGSGPPWICDQDKIFSGDDPSIKVCQISVSCADREVALWDQPIVSCDHQSRLTLLLGEYRGALHLLVQARLEAGSRNGFELTTTVQAEATKMSRREKEYAELAENGGKLLLDFQNSEEGGRFDRCVSEYRIILLDRAGKDQESPFHRWISLPQLSDYLRRENVITNELRSAVSSLLSVGEI